MLGLREKRCKFLEAGQFLGGRGIFNGGGVEYPITCHDLVEVLREELSISYQPSKEHFAKIIDGQFSVANYFRKKLHLRCSTGFWVCLWLKYLKLTVNTTKHVNKHSFGALIVNLEYTQLVNKMLFC